ncbi:MAG: ATP-binding protein [Candidatus Omnitrophica bacterium]|nr:ATP-binding protein [Candidatus Omnitrophota bacterium]
MEKLQILEILQDWNFWRKELDTGIKRNEYLNISIRNLKSNIVLCLSGVRRAGKSYLMRQLAKKLIEDNYGKENILMINFEDQRFMKFYPGLIEEIYQTYLEFLNPSKIPFIFLDEVHNIPDWERWVRTMHELGKAKIIVSDSSSKLLKGEFSTLLTGRHLDVTVFPLSFKEFLYFKGININSPLDIVSKKIEIKRFLKEYTEMGGFPEISFSEEKKRLLMSYFEDIITKDIEKRYHIKKTEVLSSLARFYLSNISKPITFNSVRKFLNTSTVTVEKFSSYLEETNLIFFLKKFSFLVKEQEKSAKKVYSIDPGISNSTGFRFTENFGRLMENIVAVELERRKRSEEHTSIYYFKENEKEIDFLIKAGLNVDGLIQVCKEINDYNVKNRELKILIKGMKKFKINNSVIITEDYEAQEKIGSKRIIDYIPLWRYLLTSEGS